MVLQSRKVAHYNFLIMMYEEMQAITYNTTLQQPVDICCLNYGNINQFIAKPTIDMPLKKEQVISIYPNPIFDGILKIKCSPIKEGEEIKIKLTDLQGRERLKTSKSISKEEIIIDLSAYALEKGMYMVSITTSTQHFVQKIIIY